MAKIYMFFKVNVFLLYLSCGVGNISNACNIASFLKTLQMKLRLFLIIEPKALSM